MAELIAKLELPVPLKEYVRVAPVSGSAPVTSRTEALMLFSLTETVCGRLIKYGESLVSVTVRVTLVDTVTVPSLTLTLREYEFTAS